MSRLLYYLIVVPLGCLPYRVLYVLGDALAAAVWVVSYRKKVVLDNLELVFPGESAQWRRGEARKFFRHLTSVMVESIRNFRASKSELMERTRHVNPEVLAPYADLSQGVILACGHYGNWERVVTFGGALSFPVMAVYKKVSDPFYESLLLRTRSRLGLEMVRTRDTKAWMERTVQLSEGEGRPRGAIILAVDQRPTDPRKAWWTLWLGQETPLHYGLEGYAHKYNMPVCFFEIRPAPGKPRGFWEVHYEMITDAPRDWASGALLEAANERVAKQIKADPQYWLWSHKRWKHKRPAEMPLK
jgi:KDO2-lipid IV(A) lauroyltransferase